MTLRLKFILAVGLLHGVLVALAFSLRTTNPVLFGAAEVLLVASGVLTYQLYRGFVRPFQLIAAGTQAIQAGDFTLKFVPVGQHEMDQLIGVYNAMIDHLRLERVQQYEKSYLLQQLIDASPAGILLLDFDGRVAEANPAASTALQQPASALRGLLPAALPGEWGPALGDLRPGEPATVRLSGVQTYRAHRTSFVDRGFPRAFILLEELTRDLIRQEKLAYEQLIRMMSHEINNSIGAVNSLLQSFHTYAPYLPDADRPDFTEALDVAHTRNTHLVNFIGSFATLVRLPAPERRPVDLHELLRATCRLLAVPSQHAGVRWQWALAPGPFWVDADAPQLEQALLNIAKNALEAIKTRPVLTNEAAQVGGTITIRTRMQPLEMRIENDGAPIPPAVRQRLFTPFFSTKRDGQGIGLTLVRDILLAHEYQFDLATEANGCTAFTIWPGPPPAPVERFAVHVGIAAAADPALAGYL
ncbi:MAG: HAMP domain-containing protein [Hymenobacteraceae bacterium]|nr:HAMP domain-containing protein [Hymenobacteraceae bacterium]